LPSFLDFFRFQIDKLDPKLIEFIINRSIAAYKKRILPIFPSFLFENFKLLQKKNIKIQDLEIETRTDEEDVIKLLSVDTNMT
jgi:hypothetical protein